MSFTNLHLHFIIWWPILGGTHANSSIVDGLLAQFHCIRAAATETHAWIEMAQIWISCDIIMRFIIDIHWYIMQSHPSYPFWIILNHFEHFWSLPTNLTHHDRCRCPDRCPTCTTAAFRRGLGRVCACARHGVDTVERALFSALVGGEALGYGWEFGWDMDPKWTLSVGCRWIQKTIMEDWMKAMDMG